MLNTDVQRKKRCSWSHEQMKEAVEKIKTGEMTAYHRIKSMEFRNRH